jgi:superfamily II DNA/RNA helicase
VTSTSRSFAALGVDPRLVRTLADRGIVDAFPIQAMTIPDALAGRDICGKAKTGSGKTLAFGIPTLMKAAASTSAASGHPAALALTPTRELAIQVADVLAPLATALERTVVAVHGGANLKRQADKLQRGADLVVATPGRLIDMIDRGAANPDEVRTLVIDEADRLADMGFLPQVEWILRHLPPARQTLLYSATLDSTINGLVRRYLREPVYHEVTSSTLTVEEMEHCFFKVHQLDKAKVAAAIVASGGRALVFVRTKRGADHLLADLRRERVRVGVIHGDLPQKLRERAVADFTSGKLPALVATDVAARGLDIEGVNLVVHYDPAEDHKTYLHRSGRTARAGAAGTVVTLVLWDQELAVERVKRRLGLTAPLIEVFSNDPRLGRLGQRDGTPPGESEDMREEAGETSEATDVSG